MGARRRMAARARDGAPAMAAGRLAMSLAFAGAALAAGADPAFATSDTTFGGPLGTVTNIVSGTGGQLAAALAVGAALVGSVLRFKPDAADGGGRRRRRGGRGHRHRDRPGRHGDRLMNDAARHTIPRRLDDPERWLFWTVDEAAALMGPALLGLAANQFVAGLVAGVGGWLLLRRVKRGGGDQHRALRALLVPAGLRAAAQGDAAEPPAAVRRLMRRARSWKPASGARATSASRWRACWRSR